MWPWTPKGQCHRAQGIAWVLGDRRARWSGVWARIASWFGYEDKDQDALNVADDLGFNDVSFHGSTQIPTPAIDELAATGLTLDNYHAQPVCSPTRASILSGRHAIHHGIYMPFGSAELRLNLTYTLLPGYLKRLGYETHAVGKWHIGENELAALPTKHIHTPWLMQGQLLGTPCLDQSGVESCSG